MIVDAHMHMEEAYPAEILKEQDIACIANAATPEEYKRAARQKSFPMDQCRYSSMEGG